MEESMGLGITHPSHAKMSYRNNKVLTPDREGGCGLERQ